MHKDVGLHLIFDMFPNKKSRFTIKSRGRVAYFCSPAGGLWLQGGNPSTVLFPYFITENWRSRITGNGAKTGYTGYENGREPENLPEDVIV